jgi:hypothetical protein
MGDFDDLWKAAPAEERAIADKYLKLFAAEVEADVATITADADKRRADAEARADKLATDLQEIARLSAENAALAAPPATPTDAPSPASDAPSTAEALGRLADAVEMGVSINLSVSSSEDLAVAVRSADRPPKPGSGALRSRRVVMIWLAVAAIVLTAVFPPWSQGVRAGVQIPLAYGPIWSPPDAAAQIDMERLGIEWFLLGSIFGGIFLTLEEFLAFASARRKVLRQLAGIAVCGLLVAVVGPQNLLDTYRRYGSDYKTDERSSAWTAYADSIRARYCDATISASVQDYLGNERYRTSSYVESPDFEGRMYITVVLQKEAPSSAQSAPTWGVETSEVRKEPGGPTVPEPQTPKINARSSAWTTYLDGIGARYRDAKVNTQDPSSTLDYLGDGRYRASSYVESSDFQARLYFTAILKKDPWATVKDPWATVKDDPWAASSDQSAPTWRVETSEVRKVPGGPTVPEPSPSRPLLNDPWSSHPPFTLNPLDTGKKQ